MGYIVDLIVHVEPTSFIVIPVTILSTLGHAGWGAVVSPGNAPSIADDDCSDLLAVACAEESERAGDIHEDRVLGVVSTSH